jgi:hypothetical protein
VALPWSHKKKKKKKKGDYLAKNIELGVNTSIYLSQYITRLPITFIVFTLHKGQRCRVAAFLFLLVL